MGRASYFTRLAMYVAHVFHMACSSWLARYYIKLLSLSFTYVSNTSSLRRSCLDSCQFLSLQASVACLYPSNSVILRVQEHVDVRAAVYAAVPPSFGDFLGGISVTLKFVPSESHVVYSCPRFLTIMYVNRDLAGHQAVLSRYDSSYFTVLRDKPPRSCSVPRSSPVMD